MKAKDLIVHHLRYTLEKDSTQPSLRTSVANLNAGQAAWKPFAERHSTGKSCVI